MPQYADNPDMDYLAKIAESLDTLASPVLVDHENASTQELVASYENHLNTAVDAHEHGVLISLSDTVFRDKGIEALAGTGAALSGLGGVGFIIAATLFHANTIMETALAPSGTDHVSMSGSTIMLALFAGVFFLAALASTVVHVKAGRRVEAAQKVLRGPKRFDRAIAIAHHVRKDAILDGDATSIDIALLGDGVDRLVDEYIRIQMTDTPDIDMLGEIVDEAVRLAASMFAMRHLHHDTIKTHTGGTLNPVVASTKMLNVVGVADPEKTRR